MKNISIWFLRIALAVGFLSAVADRFGLWGLEGSPNVAWGNMENFMDYVATLNSFLPSALYAVLGWMATIAELIIAIGLLLGWKLVWFSYAAFILLLLFALSMTFTTGIKTAFDASVYSAAAGALALAMLLKENNHIK